MNIAITTLSLKESKFLLLSIFWISFCGLMYELLIGSISSYLLGDSITHFSFSIGFFMFFMGVGAYLSKLIATKLLTYFVLIEIIIGIVGGLSSCLLLTSYSLSNYYYITGFILVAIIGTGIGLEVPLVTRLIAKNSGTSYAIAATLGIDYLGALFASIIFPILLLPWLGILQTSFLIGILNIIVAIVTIILFHEKENTLKDYLSVSIIGLFLLISGFYFSTPLTTYIERESYQDQIIHASQTPYQRIVITKHRNDTRLFLNGNIQFSSVDESRYHEPLVHIPISQLKKSNINVLLLGAGDGLVVKELLKYDNIQKIVLVDLDKQMVKLATSNRHLWQINNGSLRNKKVQINFADAFKFIESDTFKYDLIIADLPDPDTLSLGKLYSRTFYYNIRNRLSNNGIFITQATSPYFSREAFWCIVKTLESAFSHVWPMKTYVPSFGGMWGMVMASNSKHSPDSVNKVAIPTKFISPSIISEIFKFDRDMTRIPVEISTLFNQKVVQYYESSWDNWE
jgi:spermidine synthase